MNYSIYFILTFVYSNFASTMQNLFLHNLKKKQFLF